MQDFSRRAFPRPFKTPLCGFLPAVWIHLKKCCQNTPPPSEHVESVDYSLKSRKSLNMSLKYYTTGLYDSPRGRDNEGQVIDERNPVLHNSGFPHIIVGVFSGSSATPHLD